jgi:hypothetical protein
MASPHRKSGFAGRGNQYTLWEAITSPLNQPLANLAIAALETRHTKQLLFDRLVDNLAGIARVMSDPRYEVEELP